MRAGAVIGCKVVCLPLTWPASEFQRTWSPTLNLVLMVYSLQVPSTLFARWQKNCLGLHWGVCAVFHSVSRLNTLPMHTERSSLRHLAVFVFAQITLGSHASVEAARMCWFQ